MRAAFFAGIGAAVFATMASAEEAAPVKKGGDAVKPIIELRLRSESVEQAGLAEEANATTLRARLGFESRSFADTALLAEAELVWPWQGDYNSAVNGRTAFPVVADPEAYELNRVQLANTSFPQTTVTLGRQRINLDDQRFVGNVGWRQNEQTFDSLRIVNKSIARLTVDLAYLNQINRVFGADSPVGRYHGDNVLANLACLTTVGTLTGFAYLLDFDEAAADSSQTFGLRLTGSRPAGHFAVAYSAAYARQQGYAENPIDYQDDYYALELNGTLREYTFGAGVEVLQSNGVKGFATPLATLHKFQGWADKFLNTPPNGIDDRYLSAGYLKKELGPLRALSLAAVYHEYRSERLALDYGSEVGLQLQAKWQHFAGLLKYADYNARQFATDTRKLWAQIEYVW